jgi:dipeptidyl aminopeptidase/acylaminoacyl peptidase
MISTIGILMAATSASAEAPATFDAAHAFGARPSMSELRLSPDGSSVAYLVPVGSQGTALVTESRAPGAKPRLALSSDAKPYQIVGCNWVANDRLACDVAGIIKDSETPGLLLRVSRWIAVNADGTNPQTLATRRNAHSRDFFQHDGDIIDYLPDENGAVLMSRVYSPDTHLGTRVGSDEEGLGVDWVDTRTLKTRRIIAPRREAFEYLSDGHGVVRIMGLQQIDSRGYRSTKVSYLYRRVDSTEWHTLSQHDKHDRSGFQPLAVDATLNIAYGIRHVDGRDSLYSMKLDDTLEEHLVYSHPSVDVSGVLQIGRRQRVVGAAYTTDRDQYEIFDPNVAKLLASLRRALKDQPLIEIGDTSVDETVLIVVAGSDTDPGVYHLFDRKSHELNVFNVRHRELEDTPLASMKMISYPSGDGVEVPAYLTLPPGHENATGLPAIVMPHGGPTSRDFWGFDWLPQFYAHQGYAVLQPEFRGSSGYGDRWFQHTGYRSWRTAIDDVLNAGRWLVKQGIADPTQLAIVGWSYGGYAALQSSVIDPTLFKGVVAIAPVTDLPGFVEEHRDYDDYEIVRAMIGEGTYVHDGSPIEHVKDIRAPILLFHGTMDINVPYAQSRRFADKRQAAGGAVELVTFKDLEHQLDDSEARATLLRRSDEFLRKAFQTVPQAK